MKYSIGIVTYVKRYETFFKPLIESIKKQRESIEIIICVNGDYNQPFDEEYRQKILTFISGIKNSFVFIHPEFRSLSKLWNTCLINASNDNLLLLNDDVSIHAGFFDNLEASLSKTEKNFFLINKSWSHAFLNRHIVDEVGWFDERLLGVGGEDNDFEWRYLNKLGAKVKNKELNFIDNHSDKNNYLINQQKTHANYSKFNTDFLRLKYLESTDGQKYGLWYRAVNINETPKMYPCEKFFWKMRKYQ